jgi:hypothetical protein
MTATRRFAAILAADVAGYLTTVSATALSRICRLFVIARSSTLTYKGRAVDVKEVGRELGGPLCARRLGAQGWSAGAHHCAADRCIEAKRTVSPPISPAIRG